MSKIWKKDTPCLFKCYKCGKRVETAVKYVAIKNGKKINSQLCVKCNNRLDWDNWNIFIRT